MRPPRHLSRPVILAQCLTGLLLLLSLATSCNPKPAAGDKGASSGAVPALTLPYSAWDGANFSALRRKDGDIEYNDELVEGELERVPKAVAERFRAHNHDWQERQAKDLVEAGSNEEVLRVFRRDFFGPMYVVGISNDMQAYFLHVRNIHGNSEMQFGVLDLRTGKFSEALNSVYLKWITVGEPGEFLQRPYFRAEDFTGDGIPELVVQEQVHNGNMYNGVVYRFFGLGPASTLSQVFALETRVPDIRWNGDSEAFIVREIVERSPGMIKVKVVRTGHGSRDELGFVDYRTRKGGGGFEVAKKICVEEKSCELLVTASEKSEDDFLKRGYDFYY